ncbi:MAG: hypothetical protein R3D67_00320 [Hyphomicrobiaceae bacterium]
MKKASLAGAERGAALPSGASPWLRAAHDLRQPLQAAQLLIDLIRRSPEQAQRLNAPGLLAGSLSNFNVMLDALERLERFALGAPVEATQPIVLDHAFACALEGLRSQRPGTEAVLVQACPIREVVRLPPDIAAMILTGLLSGVGSLQNPQSWSLAASPSRDVMELTAVVGDVAGVSVRLDELFIELTDHPDLPTTACFVPGLGLARCLARAAGGELRHSADGDHATLTLQLPASPPT